MTESSVQRTIIAILKIIHNSDTPIGARFIADNLSLNGYAIGERGVRYHLRILDTNELTKRVGYSGRIITKKGIAEINNALVGDRMSLVISRIHEMVYRTTFDPYKKNGDIIINLSVMDKDEFERNIDLVNAVVKRGYTVSPKCHIFEEGDVVSNITVPGGSIGIATICSITIDGVLLKQGIPINVKYGGILDHGSGMLLANLREVPIIAHDDIMEIIDRLKGANIGGVIEHIHTGNTVLSAPISPDRIGIPIYAGINPLAVLMEKNIEVTTYPVSSVMEYRDMDKLL